MLSDRRLYAAITAFYALSRLALYLMGVRFSVSYRWQHLHDVDLLKERLWESLLYTHDFTPFLDLLVGTVLKISERHSVALYQGFYFVLGVAFVNAMAYLMRALRFHRASAFATVAFFCCTPPFIYLESFLHYEFPTASLLALAGALLHRALTTRRWHWLLLFFADCALAAYVRTSFHLVWLLAAVGLVLLFLRRSWKTVLATALAPVLAVVALYVKNLILFGFFGTSSWFGFNVSIITILRMSEDERQAWIEQKKIHPVSGVKLYSGPRDYDRFFDLSQKRGIPVLDQLDRAEGEPNYNHWVYLEISKLRMADSRYFISHYPWRYLRAIKSAYVDYFQPTTRWHPQDKWASPHLENRAVLGRWENVYNRSIHIGLLKPFGLYAPLVILIVYGTLASLRALRKSRLEGCVEEKVILFLAFCSFYVPVLSCLVIIGELERYRFMVESFMWILGLWALRRAWSNVPWPHLSARLGRLPLAR